jgi:hypothetical protein
VLSKMKKAFFPLVLLISGCSSQSFSERTKSVVMSNLSKSEVYYSTTSCELLSNRCKSSEFSQWMQDNNEIACSCNPVNK